MAIRCPQCKREFDVTLFEFDRTIRCACGNIVSLTHKEQWKELLYTHKDEEKKISQIKNLADKISFLIISTDYPRIDIEIEKGKLRDKIHELFPDRAHLYELIYEPRFKRLEEQFSDI
jgi:hypothetical protein